MKLSSRSRYGLRICYILAENYPAHVSATVLEKGISVSNKYIEKIMRVLIKEKLVSAERGVSGGYYLVKQPKEVTVGQIVRALEEDMQFIMCVCEGDFLPGNHSENRPTMWKNPIQANIPMVTSTTSSHYSVFRQRIPDYELKYAKNYVQFKNRLDGMELYLKYLEKDIWMKEVQASECFVENTFIINSLMELLTKNSGKIEIISKIYKLLNERDNVIERKCHLDGVVNGKLELINKLISEYNEISSSPKKMGQKMELGQKIRSLKMELTKSLKVNID